LQHVFFFYILWLEIQIKNRKKEKTMNEKNISLIAQVVGLSLYWTVAILAWLKGSSVAFMFLPLYLTTILIFPKQRNK